MRRGQRWLVAPLKRKPGSTAWLHVASAIRPHNAQPETRGNSSLFDCALRQAAPHFLSICRVIEGFGVV
jgi:hypothetical protein